MLVRRVTSSLLKSPNFGLVRHITVRPDIYGGKARPPLLPEERKFKKEEIPEDVKSLAQILKEKEDENPEAEIKPVNIGEEYHVKKPALELRSADARQELENAARYRKLLVSLEEVRDSWREELGPAHRKEIADHFGIFSDLFGPGSYFYPTVNLKIGYEFDEELITPVHQGNIIPPSDAAHAPDVVYDTDEDSLWTLVMTNPDGHLTDQGSEYLHWMVGNIPGCDVSKGEELCNYLQPFPPQGTGFHRHVFLLFKQEKVLDLSSQKRPENCKSLAQRTFSTLDFYRSHKEDLTPIGLAFFQSEWDKSVKQIYHHTLNMREPSFEYQHPPYYHPPLKMYPHKEPFDRFYDRYRDKKDIAEEVLKVTMDMVSPFKEYKPPFKYPLVHLATSEKPMWLKKREELMHRRREQFRSLPK